MGRPISDTVEVYADIVCPFTHVRLRRLFALREEMERPDVAIRVRAWPLEIVNGERAARDLLREEIDELRAGVAPDLFGGFEPTLFPMSSLPALALVERAYRHDLRTGEGMSSGLRDALFEHGADVGSADVLASIAAQHGIDPADESDHASVLADHAAGRARGVTGSPHFFVHGRGFFCPTLEIERVDDRLNISFDAEAFTAFIRTCFSEPPART
jgi:predicted DsbA family dithiol-disulfide isomerase